eukprot:Filipodium_phascolosomae@DN7470_c0_g1_i1.p1
MTLTESDDDTIESPTEKHHPIVAEHVQQLTQTLVQKLTHAQNQAERLKADNDAMYSKMQEHISHSRNEFDMEKARLSRRVLQMEEESSKNQELLEVCRNELGKMMEMKDLETRQNEVSLAARKTEIEDQLVAIDEYQSRIVILEEKTRELQHRSSELEISLAQATTDKISLKHATTQQIQQLLESHASESDKWRTEKESLIRLIDQTSIQIDGETQ